MPKTAAAKPLEAIPAGPTAKVGWRPQWGSQFAFLTCPEWEVLIEGTRGGGKTDALLADFAQHVDRGYGSAWRGVLFRVTYTELTEIIKKTKELFPRIFPKRRLPSGRIRPAARYNASSHTWHFPDGEWLGLRYARRPADCERYKGHEYPWIGWEELTAWATDECYMLMRACSRASVPGIPYKIRATTNPYGVGHGWCKRYWIDPAPAGRRILSVKGSDGTMLYRVRIHSDLSENTALLAGDPTYRTKLEGYRNESLRRAWLLGDWNIVAGGAIDDVWDESIHVVPPFRIPRRWRIDRGYDYGSANPFSVLWYAESDGTEVEVPWRTWARPGEMPVGRHKAGGARYIRTELVQEEDEEQTGPVVLRSWPRGTIFVIGEWYGGNENEEGLRWQATPVAHGVLRRDAVFGPLGRVLAGPADSSIWDDDRGESIARQMEKQGVYWTKSNKGPGSRVNGLALVRERLEASMQQPMETPGLFMFDHCRRLVSHLPQLQRDETDPEDVDTNQPDHDYDNLRYRLLAQERSIIYHGSLRV